MYHLAIQLPFDLTLVSRATFENKEQAEEHWHARYPYFPAIEILTEAEIKDLSSRIVLFPEKEVK